MDWVSPTTSIRLRPASSGLASYVVGTAVCTVSSTLYYGHGLVHSTMNLYVKVGTGQTNHSSSLQYAESQIWSVHRTVSPECEHLPYGVLAQNVLAPRMLELCVEASRRLLTLT